MSERDGARLYVEERGGRLVPCDSRSDPAGTAACVRALADSGVRVVVGPMYSNEAESAIAAASSEGVLLVSPSVTTSRLEGRDDAMLRVIGSNRDEAAALVALLRDSGVGSPLVAWARLNAAYTEPIADGIAAAFPGASTIASFVSSIDLQFDSIVASAPPETDAWVILGTPVEGGVFARAVRSAHPGARLFGCQSVHGLDLTRIGGAAAEGMAITGYTALEDVSPERLRFAKRFRETFGRERSWASTFAWEAACASEPAWDAPNFETARRRVLERGEIAPLGVPFRIDRFGDARREIELHVVRDGKLTLSVKGARR